MNVNSIGPKHSSTETATTSSSVLQQMRSVISTSIRTCSSESSYHVSNETGRIRSTVLGPVSGPRVSSHEETSKKSQLPDLTCDSFSKTFEALEVKCSSPVRIDSMTHPNIVQNRSYKSTADSVAESRRALAKLSPHYILHAESSEFFKATTSKYSTLSMMQESSGDETFSKNSSIKIANKDTLEMEKNLNIPGGERSRARRVVGRSISLNFNAAHALNLRLRRGCGLLSPLDMKQSEQAFCFDVDDGSPQPHNLLEATSPSAAGLLVQTFPQRRESFLYRSDADADTSPKSASRYSSLGIDSHSEELIVTPFAQILASLKNVRSNYVALTNVPNINGAWATSC